MKKIIPPLIALIAGLLIGYFYCKNSGPSFSGSSDFGVFAVKSPKGKISRDTAFMMRDTFYKYNKGLLMGEKGQPLKGFFIKRKDLEDILTSPKKYEGISFYLGQHPDYLNSPSERIYSLIFMGRKFKTFGVLSDDDDEDGPYYDQVDVCPDKCGNFYDQH